MIDLNNFLVLFKKLTLVVITHFFTVSPYTKLTKILHFVWMAKEIGKREIEEKRNKREIW